VKKLKIEELHVESFATSSKTARRGTVVAHNTADGVSCDTWCTTEANRASCSPAQCTGTTPGTQSADILCYTAVGCSDSCTGPYGCACTKTESFDYTFCNDTMCC
jgi:hypothetical protein